MHPIRIQRKRTKGFNLHQYSKSINGLECVVVSRPTKWGNPYIVGKDGKLDECIEKYKHLFDVNLWTSPNKSEAREELKGKNLSCWCPIGQKCHADYLLEIANK